MYADSRTRGAAYTLVLVGSTAALGTAAERVTRAGPRCTPWPRRRPPGRCSAAPPWAARPPRSAASSRPAIWSPPAPSSPTSSAGTPAGSTPPRSPAQPSSRLPRTPRTQSSRPLLLGAFGGIAGLAATGRPTPWTRWSGHRSARINTSAGRSARLDDLLNLAGSRLTAVARSGARTTVGGRANEPSRRGGAMPASTPAPTPGRSRPRSPGRSASRLGGRNTYGERVEERNTLGDGPPPEIRDIERAHQLADRVGAAALAISVVLALRPTRRQRQGR